MSPFIDLSGSRYGRLVIKKRSDVTLPSGRRIVAWRAKCDCGNTTTALAGHIRSGRTKSCGCLSAEMSADRVRTHGCKDWPEYAVWKAMIRRCYNKNVDAYEYYGGRGIAVCNLWRFGKGGKSGFQCFVESVGRRPPNLTLDRIDNDGNYEPGNCRWATRSEQMKNQRARKKRAT